MPKILFNKNFKEVERMVVTDKCGYLQLATEQYFAISHQGLEKVKLKTN